MPCSYRNENLQCDLFTPGSTSNPEMCNVSGDCKLDVDLDRCDYYLSDGSNDGVVVEDPMDPVDSL